MTVVDTATAARDLTTGDLTNADESYLMEVVGDSAAQEIHMGAGYCSCSCNNINISDLPLPVKPGQINHNLVMARSRRFS